MENIILRFFFSLQQDFSCDRCHISHLGNNRHNGSNQLFIIKYKLNCIQYFTLCNFHSIANKFAPYWIRPVIVVQEKSHPGRPHPTIYVHDFEKLKILLFENASTWVPTFLSIFSQYLPLFIAMLNEIPTLPHGSKFEQLLIFTPWECFHASLRFSGQISSKKKISRIIVILYLFLCTNSINYIEPTLHPGIMIWTDLNLC